MTVTDTQWHIYRFPWQRHDVYMYWYEYATSWDEESPRQVEQMMITLQRRLTTSALTTHVAMATSDTMFESAMEARSHNWSYRRLTTGLRTNR